MVGTSKTLQELLIYSLFEEDLLSTNAPPTQNVQASSITADTAFESRLRRFTENLLARGYGQGPAKYK